MTLMMKNSKSDMEPCCRRVFVNPALPLQPTHKTNSVAPFYITAAIAPTLIAL